MCAPAHYTLEDAKKRPDFQALTLAQNEGNEERHRRLHEKVARDGSRSFLSRMRNSATSSICAYQARAEGRKGAQNKFSRRSPLRNPYTGALVFESSATYTFYEDI